MKRCVSVLFFFVFLIFVVGSALLDGKLRETRGEFLKRFLACGQLYCT